MLILLGGSIQSIWLVSALEDSFGVSIDHLGTFGKHARVYSYYKYRLSRYRDRG
jgi:hypothetical protein